MWRYRITQYSLVATRLTMTFQYFRALGNSNQAGFLSLRGAKSFWRCCRLGVLFYSELTPFATRRDGDDMIRTFQNIWGLDCLEVVTKYN